MQANTWKQKWTENIQPKSSLAAYFRWPCKRNIVQSIVMLHYLTIAMLNHVFPFCIPIKLHSLWSERMAQVRLIDLFLILCCVFVVSTRCYSLADSTVCRIYTFCIQIIVWRRTLDRSTSNWIDWMDILELHLGQLNWNTRQGHKEYCRHPESINNWYRAKMHFAMKTNSIDST